VWGQSNQSVCSGLLECRRTSWDQDRPPLRLLLCLLLLSLALFQITVREGRLLTKMHSDKVLSYAQRFASFPVDTPIQLLTSRNLPSTTTKTTTTPTPTPSPLQRNAARSSCSSISYVATGVSLVGLHHHSPRSVDGRLPEKRHRHITKNRTHHMYQR
jgi:hypothetical protein